MRDIDVNVGSLAELKKKIAAYHELFGKPAKMRLSPSSKSYIAFGDGDDAWGTVQLVSVGKTRLKIFVDGKYEDVTIKWSDSGELKLTFDSSH